MACGLDQAARRSLAGRFLGPFALLLLSEGFLAGGQYLQDAVGIINAAGPCAAADGLQGRPETGIVG